MTLRIAQESLAFITAFICETIPFAMTACIPLLLLYKFTVAASLDICFSSTFLHKKSHLRKVNFLYKLRTWRYVSFRISVDHGRHQRLLLIQFEHNEIVFVRFLTLLLLAVKDFSTNELNLLSQDLIWRVVDCRTSSIYFCGIWFLVCHSSNFVRDYWEFLQVVNN